MSFYSLLILRTFGPLAKWISDFSKDYIMTFPRCSFCIIILLSFIFNLILLIKLELIFSLKYWASDNSSPLSLKWWGVDNSDGGGGYEMERVLSNFLNQSSLGRQSRGWVRNLCFQLFYLLMSLLKCSADRFAYRFQVVSNYVEWSW